MDHGEFLTGSPTNFQVENLLLWFSNFCRDHHLNGRPLLMELVEGEVAATKMNIDSDFKNTFSNILYREAMFSNSIF